MNEGLALCPQPLITLEVTAMHIDNIHIQNYVEHITPSNVRCMPIYFFFVHALAKHAIHGEIHWCLGSKFDFYFHHRRKYDYRQLICRHLAVQEGKSRTTIFYVTRFEKKN